MIWAMLAWLLPTLLVLPFDPAPRPGRNPQSTGRGSLPAALCERLESAVEAWLRLLVPWSGASAGQPAAPSKCLQCWFVTVIVLWQACCLAAPLYAAGHEAPLPSAGGA